jgi:hypothetical protein
MVGREMERARHKFYERLGAHIDNEWHEFQLSEKAFRDLAASG